ncbi:MAG TPA: OmpH family outer membrane protein [Pyrinomonadaceae bacterium]|nr:OmpH family outer membrane protein [Pyrinomonadaceae bacterium]
MKIYESFSIRNPRWQSISLWLLVAAAISAVVWALAVQPSSAQAVPTRIGVIDVQRVLGQSTAGRAATAKIKQLQDSRISRAKVMDEELRKLNADLSAAGVTPARRAQIEGQIADKRIAMQRFAEDADKEIGTTRDRELLALETRIKPIVDGVGKEMQLAVIFNKFESGLVYVNPSLDITDTVITRFNAAAPAAPARP